MSLKHYFEVHDQPFSRTLIYLVILTLVLLVVATGVRIVDHVRDAGSHAQELTQRLGVLSFKDGKATVEGEQPRVLWEHRVGKDRDMLVVVDTGGKLETVAKAAEFAGCAEARRWLFFGLKQIASSERPSDPKGKRKEESYKYDDQEKLDELRKLIEDNGGQMPTFRMVDDTAKPYLAEGKVHRLACTPELMVLVDTRPVAKASDRVAEAARAAGPPPSRRLIVFGPEQITSTQQPTDPNGQPKTETFGYGNEAKLGELRKLLEQHGAKLPKFEVADGKAKFALPGGKVHVLVHTPELMALVNTTDKADAVDQAVANAGAPKCRRVLLFGPAHVDCLLRAGAPNEEPKTETVAYDDAARLAEIRKHVEQQGRRMPAFELVDGRAKFQLPDAKVHVLTYTSDLMVMVDTRQRPDPIAQAIATAGAPPPGRILIYGPERIESRQGTARETYEYADEKERAELRALAEEAGAKMPDIVLEDGAATFLLARGTIHVLCQTTELGALVNATDKTGSMAEVLGPVVEKDPKLLDRLNPPEFLALVSASGVQVKYRHAAEAEKMEFGGLGELSAGTVAAWMASTARQARTSAALRQFLPGMLTCALQLFILALICSVAGLVANGVVRGGLIYRELLTMAIYATLPATLALIAVGHLAAGQVGIWILAAPVGVGMLYVVLATLRAARGRASEARPTI